MDRRKKRLNGSARPEAKRSRLECVDSALVTIKSQKLNDKYTQNMRSYRGAGHFMDGIVSTTDGSKFPVHRLFLALRSRFFMAMFCNRVTDGQEQSLVMKSPVTATDMEKLICLMYGEPVLLSEDNVVNILTQADYFLIDEVVDTCTAFLVPRIRSKYILQVLGVTEIIHVPQLHDDVVNYLLKNMEKMYNQEDDEKREYRKLPLEKMEWLLRHDRLVVSNEEMVFKIAMDWIKYNTNRRLPHVARMLSTVRIGLLPGRSLPNMKASFDFHLLQNCPEFTSYNQRVTKLLSDLDLVDQQREQQAPVPDVQMEVEVSPTGSGRSVSRPLTHERAVELSQVRYLTCPRIPPSVLFAVGGWSAGRAITLVEAYDSRTDKWYMCTETDTTPRAYHGVANLDGEMYIAGGFDGNEQFSSSSRFNPVTGTWTPCSHMCVRRCYVSLVAMDGKLYAMGGFDGSRRLKSCEVYEKDTNQWRPISSMTHIRSDADAAIYQDRIYVVGGFTGDEVLKSTEMYLANSDTWHSLAEMKEARSGVCLVPFGDGLYALGGFDGRRRLTSVERYDPIKNMWTPVTSMLTPRSNFSAAVMDGYIYVVGGYDGRRTTNLCERYDPIQDKWFSISSMNVDRSALAVCVFNGLVNRDHYTMHGQVLQLC